MRGALRLLGCSLILGVALHPATHAETAMCHLHAPADYPTFTKRGLVIPAVGNESECEQLNRDRFGSRGRCHCAPDPINPESRPSDYLKFQNQQRPLL